MPLQTVILGNQQMNPNVPPPQQNGQQHNVLNQPPTQPKMGPNCDKRAPDNSYWMPTETGFINSQPSMAEFLTHLGPDSSPKMDQASYGNSSEDVVPEYPWMKEKKTARKGSAQSESRWFISLPPDTKRKEKSHSLMLSISPVIDPIKLWPVCAIRVFISARPNDRTHPSDVHRNILETQLFQRRCGFLWDAIIHSAFRVASFWWIKNIILSCFDKLVVSTFASDGKDQTHRRIRQNSNHKPVICVHLSNAKTQSELEKKKTGENEKCLLSDRSPRLGQINDFCALDELLSSSRLVYAHSTEDYFGLLAVCI